MVSTNLLGRGIDVERVNVVINYDMADSYAPQQQQQQQR